MKMSVEEYTREAIEQFSLSELISQRKDVSNALKAYVCLKI